MHQKSQMITTKISTGPGQLSLSQDIYLYLIKGIQRPMTDPNTCENEQYKKFKFWFRRNYHIAKACHQLLSPTNNFLWGIMI